MATVRKQLNIDASPRSIWRAITTPEGLAGWLGKDGRLDPREGGRVHLTVDGQEEIGMIHEFRPTGRLEILWDKHSAGPWKGSRMLFQVARDKTESVVHVQHIHPAFEEDAARAPVENFWKAALLRLRDYLEAT